MDRFHEELLVKFCAEQHVCFHPQEWLDASARLGVDRDQLAAATWLLSSNPRYAHRDELLALAPKLSHRGQVELLRTAGVDISRFSSAVEQQVRLCLKTLRQPPPAKARGLRGANRASPVDQTKKGVAGNSDFRSTLCTGSKTNVRMLLQS